MTSVAFDSDVVDRTLREFESYVQQLESADWHSWVGSLAILVAFCRSNSVVREALGPAPTSIEDAASWLAARREGSGVQPGSAPLALPTESTARLRLLEQLFGMVVDNQISGYTFMIEVVGVEGDYDARARRLGQRLITPFARDVRTLMESLRATAVEPQFRRWGRWVALDRAAFKTTGMSAIWKVVDGDDPQRAVRVLKELRYNKGRGSAAYRRFEREIATLTARLKGVTGIVEVIDHQIPPEGTDGRPYYVMPLADSSLERAAKAYKGLLEAVLTLLLPVTNALGRAHAAGVYHRDLKPSNILLFGEANEPCVADFGIAYLADEERVTRFEGDTVGTEDYVAPELRGGGISGALTPAVDVYSLGKTLYSVVSGSGVRTLPREWLDEKRFDLAQTFLDPRLEHLTGLLRQMIAEEPANRYQDMAQCRAQFERAIANFRGGVPFEAGMYGGIETAIERYTSLLRRLDEPASVIRSDAIRTSIDDCVARAIKRANDFESQHPQIPLAHGRRHEEAAAEAASCADELLSVGLPLVRADAVEGIEEWLGISLSVFANDPLQNRVSRLVLRPSVVLAAHGAAALAWRLRRFKVLRVLIEAFVGGARSWNQHAVIGYDPIQLYTWITDELRRSELFRRAESTLAESSDDALGIFSGLAIVRFLTDASFAADVERLAKDPDAKYGGPAFLGFYWPAAKWTQTLLDACITRPPLERELAQHVFDTSVTDLRLSVARITPALGRAISRLNWEVSRDIEWRMVVDPRAWDGWCGRSTR